MTRRNLCLFPDTNVFIQCRPLEELDWSEWADFEEVHLIVCRTVQREIDRQKTRGNDRVGQRARKINSMFRQIVETGYKVIREDGPPVKLILESSSVPSNELKDRLDYSNPDDEIVGFLYQYKQQYPEADIRLLTHDTGPKMTARSLNLPFISVKDDWLLPPESNQVERENRWLKEEINRLRKAEPQFQVKCVDDNDIEVSALNIECQVYEPLTKDDLSTFMDLIRKRFPIITDFEPRKPLDRESPFSIAAGISNEFVYTPDSEKAIAKYQDQEYPYWVKSCKNVLSNLHEALERKTKPPSFCFVATNEGTRPGRDTLVDITARGNFKICPLQMEEEERYTEPSLQSPPKPPRVQWMDRPLIHRPLIDIATNSITPIAPLKDLSTYHRLMSPIANRHFQGDPNTFYYKPDKPTIPVESFSLECKQWRHGIGDEYFREQISLDGDTNQICGAVEFQIHAENLSSPVKKVLPIRILIKRVSTRDYAQALIEDLFNSS